MCHFPHCSVQSSDKNLKVYFGFTVSGHEFIMVGKIWHLVELGSWWLSCVADFFRASTRKQRDWVKSSAGLQHMKPILLDIYFFRLGPTKDSTISPKQWHQRAVKCSNTWANVGHFTHYNTFPQSPWAHVYLKCKAYAVQLQKPPFQANTVQKFKAFSEIWGNILTGNPC